METIDEKRNERGEIFDPPLNVDTFVRDQVEGNFQLWYINECLSAAARLNLCVLTSHLCSCLF